MNKPHLLNRDYGKEDGNYYIVERVFSRHYNRDPNI